MPGHWGPVPLLKFQTVNILCIQEMELKYACLSEARALNTKRGLRFLPLLPTSYIMGYWSTPLSKDVLSKVLCPVKRPVTTLDCVLLKNNSLRFAVRLATEISF